MLSPNPSVVSRRVADEIVLVHLDSNRIYSLNRTAARLWELVALGTTVQEAEAQLSTEYDIAPAELSREIEACVTKLLAEELLVQR